MFVVWCVLFPEEVLPFLPVQVVNRHKVATKQMHWSDIDCDGEWDIKLVILGMEGIKRVKNRVSRLISKHFHFVRTMDDAPPLPPSTQWKYQGNDRCHHSSNWAAKQFPPVYLPIQSRAGLTCQSSHFIKNYDKKWVHTTGWQEQPKMTEAIFNLRCILRFKLGWGGVHEFFCCPSLVWTHIYTRIF